MASSSQTNSTFSSSLSTEEGEESSWDEASFSKSLASFRQPKKRVTKTSRKVQFNNQVLAFHVDRDFWKFKCETEPLSENKRQSKSLENLKATYNEKLVNVKRKRRIIKT